MSEPVVKKKRNRKRKKKTLASNIDKVLNDTPKPKTQGVSKGMDQAVRVQIDTVDQILKRAKEIVRDARDKSQWRKWDEAEQEYDYMSTEEVMKVMQKRYSEFSKTFPVVLRDIVETKRVYPKVLKRFIGLCQHHPTHSIDEFQERQAEYLTMVYRQENPRSGPKEIARVKRMYGDQLKKEQEYMKNVMDMVQEERQKAKEENQKVKKEELLALFSQWKDKIPDDTDVEVNAKEEPKTVTEDEEEPESLVLVPDFSKGTKNQMQKTNL